MYTCRITLYSVIKFSEYISDPLSIAQQKLNFSYFSHIETGFGDEKIWLHPPPPLQFRIKSFMFFHYNKEI